MSSSVDGHVQVSPRTHLSRHPLAIECARAAASLTKSVSEVVVFESGRVFVVASSAVEALHPRQPDQVEARIVAGERGLVAEKHVAAIPIVTRGGGLVGALTMRGEPDLSNVEVLHGLARMLERLATELAIPVENAAEPVGTLVANAMRDVALVVDPNMMVVWANEAVGSLFGRTPEEIIGTSAVGLVHPDDLEHVANGMARMTEGLEMYRLHLRILRSDGEWEPVTVTGMDHSDDPRIGGVVVTLRSWRVEEEEQLALDRARHLSDALLGGLEEGLVVTDEFGGITMVNAAARAMFGLDPHVPAAQLKLSHFQTLDNDGRAVSAASDLGSDDIDTEYCIVRAKQDLIYVSARVQDVLTRDGDRFGSVIVFRDVTASRLAADQLRSQALHDQLTGLANRRQLQERMSVLAGLQPAQVVALMFVDLDGFKAVNDSHGHRTGDNLIRAAADRLRGALRDTDLLVRQGGDEFVVLHMGISNADQALETAERLRDALSAPYLIDDQRFDVTASIGVAIATTDELAEEMLLQRADMALYAAKSRGRNCVERFDIALEEELQLGERQRRLLRDVLDEDRLVMHFQPVVDCDTEQVNGYEALARFRMEDGQIVGPGKLLESVTNSRLAWELDQAAFRLSCEAAAALARIEPDNTPLVCCNFSPLSVRQLAFVDFLEETVISNGVDPSKICVEITESAAFDVGEASRKPLDRVRALGFGLALDDFGTGYSSLVHLRDLPISAVKVDRSFIARLGSNGSERAIVEAVVSLANELGLDVIAEGAETKEQSVEARALGFTQIQGWYYSPAISFAEVLRSRRSHRESPTSGL